MFKTILLPIDGSALSARAVPFALRLATSANTQLIVVRAYLPSDDSLSSRLHYPEKSRAERAQIDRDQARAEFQSEVDRLRERDCPVGPYFVEGAAADVIFETARQVQASVVVMSTHGRSGFGRWLYGSVADEAIRRVPVPVLLVSPVCGSDWTHPKATRVLVPLDGSDLAAEVLQPATDLAASLDAAEMMLLAIVEPPVGGYPDEEVQVVSDPVWEQEQAMEYLETVAAKLASSAPGSITRRIAFGDAAPTIASVARDAEVDVIAMATHGRSGLARLALGSVATRTLQLAKVPVLVYRPVVLRETVLERAVQNAVGTPTGSTP
jgi:nucleotide-binding universal stress UspA family protein